MIVLSTLILQFQGQFVPISLRPTLGTVATGFPGGSVVKNLPANEGDTGSTPGWEDPLEKEMTTHSNTFALKIPCMEEPTRLQSMGSQRVGHD